jgi:D-aminopeptidase
MTPFDERKIDAIFADLNQCHLPGVAVGVAIDGKPVYRKGFGLANLELPIVLTPATRMRIGSTSKHFTCFAYLLLCEEGKASLDDPLGKLMPELHPAMHGVTMRQLMANTSGIRDVNDFCWQFFGLAPGLTNTELLSLYRHVNTVNAAPGTSWCYNNGGFMIVGEVIERITGQSLEQVMTERIFQPLGMHDTLLRRRDTDFVPSSATPHMVHPAGHFEKWRWMDHAGQGGIVSTADDMLRWLANMTERKVGNATTWAAMTEPNTLTDGTSTGYALGLFSEPYRGMQTLHHAGGWLGAGSQMLKVPAAGLDVTVMTNHGGVNPATLVHRIVDACVPGLEPARAPHAGPLARGVFRSPRTHRVIQLSAREGQQIVSIGGFDFPFARDRQGVLRLNAAVDGIRQPITLVGPPETPTSIRLDQFGNFDELVTQKAADESDARAIVGRYRSAEADTEITISIGEDGPQMHAVGRFGSVVRNLECLAEGIWRARNWMTAVLGYWGGVLAFDIEGRGFHYSTLQTWALHFSRID